MNFTPDDFPILKLNEKQYGPLGPQVIDDFEKARLGGDEEKYTVALTVYTLVNGAGYEPEGTTPELYEYTRKQCFDIFADGASRNHVPSIVMTAYCYREGHGCERNPALAAAWQRKAEQLSKPPALKPPSR